MPGATPIRADSRNDARPHRRVNEYIGAPYINAGIKPVIMTNSEKKIPIPYPDLILLIVIPSCICSATPKMTDVMMAPKKSPPVLYAMERIMSVMILSMVTLTFG